MLQLRLINPLQDLTKQGRSLDPAIHFIPIEWLKRPIPYPSHLVERPLARPAYALDRGVQRKTSASISYMETIIAMRRRHRIEQIGQLPPTSTLNCASFVDYLTEYPLKTLNEFFGTIGSDLYSTLKPKIKAKQLSIRGASVIKVDFDDDILSNRAHVYILPSLDLDSTPTWVRFAPNHSKLDVLVTDLFSAMYFDKKALSGKSEPEKTCLISSGLPLHYLIASPFMDPLNWEDDFCGPETIGQGPDCVTGAPNREIHPQRTDEEVKRLCFSHADFDRYALSRDRELIRQFVRWKKFALSTTPPNMVGLSFRISGNYLCPPLYPRYDLEPLPEETQRHVEINRRKTYPDFAKAIGASPPPAFALTLDAELPRSSYSWKYSRTFKCSFQDFASHPTYGSISTPSNLVVKLFDDYRGELDESDYEDRFAFDWNWAMHMRSADEYLRDECHAYLRLKHVWGSTVPWFYGAFMFDLSDGRRLPGILLEYVEPCPGLIQDLPENTQIAIIKSGRHAVRVLQRADISRADWSQQNIIVAKPVSYEKPDSIESDSPQPIKEASIVLNGFSHSGQGDIWGDAFLHDDYGGMIDCLAKTTPDIEPDGNTDGVPPELLIKWYERKEKWDYLASSVSYKVVDSNGNEVKKHWSFFN